MIAQIIKLHITVSVFVLLSGVAIYAQSGCTDPQATNFDPFAIQNDGSCMYPVTYYTPVFRANIDSDLKEISGLHLADNEWWAHNDSGYDPFFFSLDPESGNVLKSIEIKDASNHDWEDICSDGVNLYIGDFGNNTNDRDNLGIYRIPYTAIGNSGNQTIHQDEYTFLPFAYPDQSDFTSQPEDSTVFDCEAMIFAGNKLHLFTKNRRDYQTSHYTINPVTGEIQKTETFDSQGLITGASMSNDGKLITLVGYDLRGLPTVFCWLLWDWQAGTDQYFSGNKRRIELGSAFSIGQVESIAFGTARSGYIANERTEYNGILIVPQTTRSFDFSQYVPQTVSTQQPAPAENQLKIYPNPGNGMLFLESEEAWRSTGVLSIITPVGETIMTLKGIPEKIDIGGCSDGLYYIVAKWPDGTTIRRSFVIHH